MYINTLLEKNLIVISIKTKLIVENFKMISLLFVLIVHVQLYTSAKPI